MIRFIQIDYKILKSRYSECKPDIEKHSKFHQFQIYYYTNHTNNNTIRLRVSIMSLSFCCGLYKKH